MITVFVDGQEGTTGLQIHERLARRNDIEMLQIDPALRKDVSERARLLNAADIAFLCLPDAAAKESAALVTNPHTVVIDASTAHRVHPDWTYGLPELSAAQRSKIAHAKKIANPGCYATGFILAAAPLVQAGVLPSSAQLVCHAVSGYSGAGKKLIALYEVEGAQVSHPGESPKLFAPRAYAHALRHKHLPEMRQVSGLDRAPIFTPIVGPYYKGMAVTIALFPEQLTRSQTPAQLADVLTKHYAGQTFVRVHPYEETPTLDGGFLDPTTCNDSNRAEVHIFGHAEQMEITVVLDNLGKGASGAAVQNMNIALGLDESLGF
ncbi:MAG TPA: N-acetyl-gamma-glutamyl-phosphate reductase [Fibrobacteraceae bacterium]|nr:N-acetyl-gamma-glutamyl-phosphate reductase [Fibrobacteraceae bacterium]